MASASDESPADSSRATGAALDVSRVGELLAAAGVAWSDLTVVASTGSTNADLADRVVAGTAREGTVIAAGEQTAGRGRLGRTWESPAGTTVSFSVALAPPVQRASFVPALTGMAVAQAIGQVGGPATTLKWPNDVIVADGKVAGILAEAVDGIVVVGCGINVSIPADQLPAPAATSLSLHGQTPDRTELLAACLERMSALNARWKDASYDVVASGLLADYRAACGTIGARVSVRLPDGSDIGGTATDVDELGRLVLVTPEGQRTLTAGDVIHLHPA